MKLGDIFYFVDLALCKVTKHKVIEITPQCTDGKIAGVRLSYFQYKLSESCICINPKIDQNTNIRQIITSAHRTAKNYLVFTTPELAQQALVEYALPEKIKMEAEICKLKQEECFKAIEKMNLTEENLKKQKESFEKKCNALKKKFV